MGEADVNPYASTDAEMATIPRPRTAVLGISSTVFAVIAWILMAVGVAMAGVMIEGTDPELIEAGEIDAEYEGLLLVSIIVSYASFGCAGLGALLGLADLGFRGRGPVSGLFGLFASAVLLLCCGGMGLR